MSRAPAGIEPLRQLQPPPAVRLGLEMERRGMEAPPHVGLLTREYRRRGLVGQEPFSPEPFDVGADEQQRRAAMRFGQIGETYQPPSQDDRAEHVRGRMGEWLTGIAESYRQSARIGGRELTYEDRSELWRSLDPRQVEQAREHFGGEWDQKHSELGEFERQREEAGQLILEAYREDHPGADEQTALRHMHHELARLGYTPSFAGQLEPVTDQRSLEAAIHAALRRSGPLVDRGLSLGGAGDYIAGVLHNLPVALHDVVGQIGLGSIATALEKQLGDDMGLRDVQRVMQAYFVDTPAEHGIFRPSERMGAAGEYQRFAHLMGGVTTDLAAMLILSRIGMSGAQGAGFSARMQTLAARLAGGGYMGTRNAGGIARDTYTRLRIKGYDHETANDRAMIAGVAAGTVNMALLAQVPIHQFLLRDPAIQGRFVGALRGLIAEGGIEAAQEFTSIAAMIEAGAIEEDIFDWEHIKQILTASLAGGLVGAGLGGAQAGRGFAADVAAKAQRERELAIQQVIEQAERARRDTQRHKSRRVDPPRPDREGTPRAEPAPRATRQTPTTDQGGPGEAGRTRSDPKIIATPKQMANWYAKEFNDPAGAGAIEGMIQGQGERMRLVRIPLELVQPTMQVEGQVDPSFDQSKVDAIAGLDDQSIADLPPIIAVGSVEAGLQLADGSHRVAGIARRGGDRIWGYVPQSVAEQLETGRVQRPVEAGPPAPTEQTGRPAEGTPRPEAVPPAERGQPRPDDVDPGRELTQADMTNEAGATLAEAAGVKFEGVQVIAEGEPPLLTFTDPQTQSTFLVGPGQSVTGQLQELRAKFEAGARRRREREQRREEAQPPTQRPETPPQTRPEARPTEPSPTRPRPEETIEGPGTAESEAQAALQRAVAEYRDGDTLPLREWLNEHHAEYARLDEALAEAEIAGNQAEVDRLTQRMEDIEVGEVMRVSPPETVRRGPEQPPAPPTPPEAPPTQDRGPSFRDAVEAFDRAEPEVLDAWLANATTAHLERLVSDVGVRESRLRRRVREQILGELQRREEGPSRAEPEPTTEPTPELDQTDARRRLIAELESMSYPAVLRRAKATLGKELFGQLPDRRKWTLIEAILDIDAPITQPMRPLEQKPAEPEPTERPPMRMSDLPYDMQDLIRDLVNHEVPGDTTFTVRQVPVAELPDVATAEGTDGDGRSVQDYAGVVRRADLPPIVLHGRQWLDGRHRVKAARLAGMETVPAIDLAEAGLPQPSQVDVLGTLGQQTTTHTTEPTDGPRLQETPPRPTQAPPETGRPEGPPEPDARPDQPGETTAEQMTVDEARTLVRRFYEMRGQRTPEQQAAFRRALETIDEHFRSTAAKVEQVGDDMTVWWFPPDEKATKAERTHQIAEQARIRQKIEEAGRQKLPKRAAKRPAKRPAKPRKPARAQTRASIQRRIGTLAQGTTTLRGARIDQGGRRIMATDGAVAWMLIHGEEGYWGQEGTRQISRAGQLGEKMVEHEARNIATIPDIIRDAQATLEPATTVDLAATISALNRIRIVAPGDEGSAVVVVNPDGSLGFAAADFEAGVAEINVLDGAREAPHNYTPARLLESFEMAYAIGANEATVRILSTKPDANQQPAVIEAIGPETTLKAVVGSRTGERTPTLQTVRRRMSDDPDTGQQRLPTTEPTPERAPESQMPDEGPGGPVAGMPEGRGDAEGRGFDADSGRAIRGRGRGRQKPLEPRQQPEGMLDYRPSREAEGRVFRRREDQPARVHQNLQQIIEARQKGIDLDPADTIYAIIDDLGRRFNIGPAAIGRHKALQRTAAGLYEIIPQRVRLRKGSYVYTFVHELGHHLHKTMFPRRGSRPGIIAATDFPREWRKDLVTLGQDLYSDRKPPTPGAYTSEGWAEVVRFLFTNPGHLKQRTPELYADVVNRLVRGHPEVWTMIREGRVRLLAAIERMRSDPIDQYVAHDRKEQRTWRQRGNTALFEAVDDANPIRVMLRDLGIDPETMPAHLNPHTAALRSRSHIAGDLRAIIEDGIFDPADPTRAANGPSLRAVLQRVGNDEAIREWQNYMVARRVIEKRSQGYDVMPQDARLPGAHLSTPNLARWVKRVESDKPHYAEAARDFQRINRWLIERYAVAYDLVTPEAAQLITDANLEYITFRWLKHSEQAQRTGKAAGRRMTGWGSGIRRFNPGQGQQLYPPLDSFFASMQGIVSRARLNHVAGMTIIGQHHMPGAGRWFSELTTPMEAHRIGSEQLRQEVFKQLGIREVDGGFILPPDLKGLTEDQIMAVVEALQGIEGTTFWKPGRRTDGENLEVTVMHRGKPRFFRIAEKELFQTLEGMGSPTTVGTFWRAMRLPATVLRQTATRLNPDFFNSNWFRDFWQSITLTEASWANVGQQFKRRWAGYRSVFRGGELARLFKISGGDMAAIWNEYYNPGTRRYSLAEIRGDKIWRSLPRSAAQAKRMLGDLASLGPIARINDAIESSNRLAEFAVVYHGALDAGKTTHEAMAEAGQASADIAIDYLRSGRTTRQINQFIPFFNAAIRGPDKMIRFIRDHPGAAAGRIFAGMIVPSMIQALLNWNNDDYWAQPKEKRDRWWMLPIGFDDAGTRVYMTFPKPYALATFSIATERSLARLMGIDPETGERGDPRAMDGMTWAILRELRPTLNLAGLQPLLEATPPQGWSIFWGRPIVPTREADLPAGDQGAEISSTMAQYLGAMLDYPPAKIDYLIRNWFGGVGANVTFLGDRILEAAGAVERTGPPVRTRDYPVIRRFIGRQTRGEHEAIRRFFDDYQNARSVRRGLTFREEVRPQDVSNYRLAHEFELRTWPIYDATQRDMRRDFEEMRRLYRMPDMDPDELDRRLNTIHERIVGKAQEAHRRVRRLAEARREAEAAPPPRTPDRTPQPQLQGSP